MMDREKAKHIDAFKYWCESNEENGVITIPKFLCEHIVEILYDAKARPHGEWDFIGNNLFKCTHCGYVADADYLRKWKVHTYDAEFPTACLKCGADMEKFGHWFSDWSECYGKDGFRCSTCGGWTSEKKEKCSRCGTKMKEGEAE